MSVCCKPVVLKLHFKLTDFLWFNLLGCLLQLGVHLLLRIQIVYICIFLSSSAV